MVRNGDDTGAADTYVALIRGINVGRAKRVSMADLRAGLESLGYGDVATLLNSGNVLFTAAGGMARGAAARIESLLASKIGVPARVVVLNASDVDAIVADNTLTAVATNPSRLMVSVLFNPSDRRRLAQLAIADWTPEAVSVGSRAVYVWCPDGMRDSAAQQAIGRALGEEVTTRNWSTIEKLHALVQSARRPSTGRR